jgi:hypothetical protein
MPALKSALAARSDLPASLAANAASAQAAEIDNDLGHASARSPSGMAERLVGKLASSGQLRAGFLLRVLQQGQIELFDAGLARLLDLPVERASELFYGGGPASVALACRAVGIDRCVFPTVYSLSRRLRDMPSDLGSAEKAAVDAVFESHSRPAALALLRAG